MKKDNITNLMPKITIRFIYTKGGQIELESNIKYSYPKYFCEYFYYKKNFTPPLPKEEIDKINDILNKSVVISEYEMKQLIKNTTAKNKTKTENGTKDDNDIDEDDDYFYYDDFDDILNLTNNTDSNGTNSNDTKKPKKKKNKIKIPKPAPANYTYNNTLYITTEEKKRLNNMKKIGKKKDEIETIDLKVKENHLLYPKPMNETQISNSVKRIKRYIEIDTNRTKLIEQKNKLEALIFSRKEWLDSEHAKRYLKPGELDNSTIFINNKSEWFEEEGYAATYETLGNEIKNITKYFREFERRQRRHYDRMTAINKFLTDLNSTQQRIVKVLSDKPWTEEYFNTTFLKEYNETMKWFNETFYKQENTPHWEPEVLSSYMLNKKMDNLRKHLYEMTTMKNMTKEEREKEKDKREKKKKERQNKKKGKIGDIDLDELLNKRDKDLDDLFKKYNITKEEFQKRILNDTLNNKKNEKEDKDKKNTKKETDL